MRRAARSLSGEAVKTSTAAVRRFRLRKRASLKDAAFVYALAEVGSKTELEAKAKLLACAQSYNRKAVAPLEEALRLAIEERNEAIRVARLFTLEDMHGGSYEAARRFIAKFPEVK